MRIGFFGTPSLAASVLEGLIESSDIEVCFVVTNPDKPFGRNQVLMPSRVKEMGQNHNIPTYTPEKLRGNLEMISIMRSFACDYFIVVAYGKILPREVLEIPTKMCINIHGSILPKYRGASPIQSVLLYGEKETGVTIMKMSEGMDEGDILKIRIIPIDTSETSGSLFEKFADISGPTLIQTLRELEMGGITPLPQDATLATYCTKIVKEDGLIDWSQDAETIYHMWQAYTPWPGIYTIYEGKRLLLERVSTYGHREIGSDLESQGGIHNNHYIASGTRNDRAIGQVVTSEEREMKNVGTTGEVIKLEDGGIGVICGKGILTLSQVKLEGKKSQNIGDFINGNQNFIGYNFL